MACKSCQEKSLMAKVQSGLIGAKEFIVADLRIIAKNTDYDLLAKERLSICQICPKRKDIFADTQANDLLLYSLNKTRSNLANELNAISESENPAYIKEDTLKAGCSLCGCPLFSRSFIDPNSQLVVEQKQEGCLWKQ